MTYEEVKKINDLFIFGGHCYKIRGPYMRVKIIFQYCRLLSLISMSIAIGVSIYNTGFQASIKGTLIFSPITTTLSVQAVSIFWKGNLQQEILDTLASSLLLCNQFSWQKQIIKSATDRAWAIVNRYKVFMMCFLVAYLVVPPIINTTLYSLGYVQKHYLIPSPFSDFIRSETSHTGYTVVNILGVVWGLICVSFHVGVLGTYLVLTVYCFAFLTMLKRYINELLMEDEESKLLSKMNTAIDIHASVIRLNEHLNNYLGLPIAIQNIALAMCVCLTLFVVKMTDDHFVLLSFGFSFVFYVSMAYVFCALGQLLENESNHLFEAFCDVPWYQYRPNIRKNLVMMIRQANKTITFNYRGRVIMNLQTFMQVLNTSYSYFMLLQTVVN